MFEQASLPFEFSDVLNRRHSSLSGDLRLRALGTRGLLYSYWVDGSAVILTIGDSSYRFTTKNNVKRFGNPVPGVIFGPAGAGGSAAVALENARQSVLTDSSFSGWDAGIKVLGETTVLGAGLKFSLMIKGEMHEFSTQCFYAAFLTGNLTVQAAANDLEGILIRLVAEHIERVPLKHAVA